jgi:hypothetical protein
LQVKTLFGFYVEPSVEKVLPGTKSVPPGTKKGSLKGYTGWTADSQKILEEPTKVLITQRSTKL